MSYDADPRRYTERELTLGIHESPSIARLDWEFLGIRLRETADLMEENSGVALSSSDAYRFMIENPEAFGREGWPDNMPESEPAVLIAVFLPSPVGVASELSAEVLEVRA